MKNETSATSLLANVAIVLVRPKYPENIGAAARSAKNMGINQLLVIHNELPDRERMCKMATCHARDLIDGIRLYQNLADALTEFSWVVGTTARQGRQRRLITSPANMVAGLLPKLNNNKVALLFGPEDSGLTNEDLKFCNSVTTIPTADFSSLNLAQAVAILCYEVYTGVLSSRGWKKISPKLASSHEYETTYGLIEKMLRRIGFLKETDYDHWMKNIRHFLGRVELKARETKFLQLICRQIIYHRGQVGKSKKR